MVKHTSGPWKVGCLNDDGQRVVENDHIGICTCWYQSVDSIDKEMEANAHLIAAAPDMYEALIAMVDRWEPDCIGNDRRMLEDACTALRKARGET